MSEDTHTSSPAPADLRPGLPIVECEELIHHDGTPAWRFYCLSCRKWHWHSAGAGHRQAHCHNPDSPYYSTGYVLVRSKVTRSRGNKRLKGVK
jgi:hypothetical protein